MPALYTATATATGEGRNGHTRSSDGLIDLDLAVPKEMGGAGGASNPEQLFAAGYAACFHSALKLVAGKQKVAFTDSAVTADVGIGPNDVRRLRSRDHPLGRAGRHRPGGGRAARRGRPPGVPLLQRHPGQRAGDPGDHRRLTSVTALSAGGGVDSAARGAFRGPRISRLRAGLLRLLGNGGP